MTIFVHRGLFFATNLTASFHWNNLSTSCGSWRISSQSSCWDVCLVCQCDSLQRRDCVHGFTLERVSRRRNFNVLALHEWHVNFRAASFLVLRLMPDASKCASKAHFKENPSGRESWASHPSTLAPLHLALPQDLVKENLVVALTCLASIEPKKKKMQCLK